MAKKMNRATNAGVNAITGFAFLTTMNQSTKMLTILYV